jgi:hypothetical protein
MNRLDFEKKRSKSLHPNVYMDVRSSYFFRVDFSVLTNKLSVPTLACNSDRSIVRIVAAQIGIQKRAASSAARHTNYTTCPPPPPPPPSPSFGLPRPPLLFFSQIVGIQNNDQKTSRLILV